MSLNRLPLRWSVLWFAVGLLPVPVIAQSPGTAARAAVSDHSSNLKAHGAPHALLADAASASMDTAVESGGFAVPRHVIAGGGGRSTGAEFAIAGTIGQAEADPLQPSTGGIFAIAGGFWPGQSSATLPEERLFANGFEAQLP